MESPKILLIGLVWLNRNTGSSNHFRKLRDYLAQSFKVYTITLGDKSESSTPNILIESPTNGMYRQVYWNIFLPLKIRKICKEKNIDLVYMRTTGTVIGPLYMMGKLPVKTAVEINGIISHKHSAKNPWIFNNITNLYKRLFKKIDLFTASKGYAKYLVESFDLPTQKVTSLRLGYNKIEGIADLQESLAKTNLSPDHKHFLFIGKIAPYQGLQYLVQALAAADRSTFSDWRIVVVGDGPYKKNVLDQIEKANLQSYFIFKDRVEKDILKYYLSIGAVGLSPFSPDRGKEGYISGLKTYDYLFYKMPILTSKMDDMADYIEDHKLGWVVRDFEEEEIFKLMEQALKNENQNKISLIYDEIYDEITESFSWDSRFGKIQQAIHKTITSKEKIN